jgi:hypothetical protein
MFTLVCNCVVVYLLFFISYNLESFPLRSFVYEMLKSLSLVPNKTGRQTMGSITNQLICPSVLLH